MKSLNKVKIATVLIISLILHQVTFAGVFYFENGAKKYLDDNGKIATGWRWIDTNNDNICECYRFGPDGALATRSRIKGKDVNQYGQWTVNGVVQRIYKSTGEQLYESNAGLSDLKDSNKYIDLGTASKTKRINATTKDMKALIERDLNADEEAYRKSLIGPKGEFTPTDEGYVLSKGASAKLRKSPQAVKSTRSIIDDALIEDATIYLSATASFVAGKDMRKFVSASYKYTESVNNVKIWGGDIWNDCICLQGNGAYVKFNTTDETGKYKANYFTCEIAHQTHGESTSDTDCAVELYLAGNSVASYDEFCDDKPQVVEEWLDDGESSMELRAVITGDAPGRKIYIRNMRFRQIKDKDVEDEKKEKKSSKK